MKDQVKKDWDFITIYDGIEGGGKSTKAIQDHLYLDPTLDLKRICMTSEDFQKQVINAKPYQAVIYDEAITGLYSREAKKYVNTSITKLLAQIRQKNLFIGIILPSFFDLDKYVAMWRARSLVSVYTRNMERGYFKFFSYYKKKQLYARGKKYYSYSVVKPDFIGRFTKFNPFIAAYRKKKLQALKESENKSINPYAQRDRLIIYMHKTLGVQQKIIAKILGLHPSGITKVVTGFEV